MDAVARWIQIRKRLLFPAPPPPKKKWVINQQSICQGLWGVPTSLPLCKGQGWPSASCPGPTSEQWCPPGMGGSRSRTESSGSEMCNPVPSGLSLICTLVYCPKLLGKTYMAGILLRLSCHPLFQGLEKLHGLVSLQIIFWM